MIESGGRQVFQYAYVTSQITAYFRQLYMSRTTWEYGLVSDSAKNWKSSQSNGRNQKRKYNNCSTILKLS